MLTRGKLERLLGVVRCDEVFSVEAEDDFVHISVIQ